MFKKLLSMLFSSSQTQIKPASKLASISVEVNTDGTINISCDWPTFNVNNSNKIKEIAYFYAVAIHALNKGLLEKDIIETILNYDRSDAFNGLFAQNTLIELLHIEKSYRTPNINNQNRPIISPLEVFKNS